VSFSGIARRLPGWWYRRHFSLMLLPLLPFSWLFRLLVAFRRGLYRFGVLRSYALPVPVIVIGNLTVGGSGKTPLVLWLAKRLGEKGWRPGIISRGYAGTAESVQAVTADSPCAVVGDEPLLLARRSALPVFVGRDRVAAGRALLDVHPECTVVISDDGLQHYRLQRAVEIAVFDARGAGNGRLLPAGPLREPWQRLAAVTAVVWNAAPEAQARCAPVSSPEFTMRLAGQRFIALSDAQHCCTADDLRGKTLHALAGIGDPSRFFRQLESMGLDFAAHPFPDHHIYSAADLAFADDGVLLMTEKDAVKCTTLTSNEAWVLPVEAHIDMPAGGPSLLDTILEKLDGRTPA